MAFPNVNGFDYAYASIELRIRGVRYYGATAINYDDSLSPGRTKGTSTLPIGATAGEWDGSGSIEFNRQDGQALIAALGDGYGRVIFSVTVQHAEAGMPVITDQLPAVRIMKASNSHSQGTDASKMSFDLFLMAPIIRNGVRIESAVSLAGANV